MDERVPPGGLPIAAPARQQTAVVAAAASTVTRVASRWLVAFRRGRIVPFLIVLLLLVRIARRQVSEWIWWLREPPSKIVRLKGTGFAPALYRLGEELGRCSMGGGKVVACIPQVAPAPGSDMIGNGGMTHVVFIVPQVRVTSRLELLLDLQHESIIAHERIYADDSSFYIVVEAVPGSNLLDWFVARNCYCGEVAARALITKLLAALKYLQDIRVLHRDVKLDTLLLDVGSEQASGNSEQPAWSNTMNLKLTDFTGFLRLPSGQISCCAPTTGTLMYAAPEVLEGFYHLSTDCFSAGVVLFTLLVSAIPFASDSKVSYLRDVRSRDWHVASDVAGVSSVARSLLTELLEPSPSLRYSATAALTHRWIENESYAKAQDKMHRKDGDDEDSDFELRFLKECGTGVGGPCSMSLSSADQMFDTIPEGDESRASPKSSPRSSPKNTPPHTPRRSGDETQGLDLFLKFEYDEVPVAKC